MTTRASGKFEPKLSPQPSEAGSGGPAVGRLLLVKTFRGDLQATSQGQMLAAGTPEEGSAGYVALEIVSGSLLGRAGTFVLQHNGLMTRGEAELTIVVVPDSGTGQLTGLAGRMEIRIAGDDHFYDLDFTLPNLA
jgi:hypothetical protein